MRNPQVLLADDLPEIRELVARLLQVECDIVGSVPNGEQAIEAARRLNPDIVVLDISMPGLNGFQVATRLRDSGSRTKIIFLTVHEDRQFVEAAFAVGAVGYVLKSRIAPISSQRSWALSKVIPSPRRFNQSNPSHLRRAACIDSLDA